MDAAMESCAVPPGFRFHPTDVELVGYYLRKKVASQKIDLDVIRDIDLYRIEPWHLQEHCRIGSEDQQQEWYFFSYKDRKYPTGTRTNRATMAGFWKATGRDKAVHDKNMLIGMRKTLVFYKGRAPNGQKTDWIMHEYRLETDEHAPPQEEGWVVCRAFKKRTAVQPTRGGGAIDMWGSEFFYLEQIAMGNSNGTGGDPSSSCFAMSRPVGGGDHLSCKREADHHQLEKLALLQSSSDIVMLPQLESPTMAHYAVGSSQQHQLHNHRQHKRTRTTMRDDDHHHHHQDYVVEKAVTDWRALDKFVASQLSNDDGSRVFVVDGSEQAGNSLMNNEDAEIAMLLLDGGREAEECIDICRPDLHVSGMMNH